jgi:hypothetical protein
LAVTTPDQSREFPILSDALKWLGEHRDGFLVGGAILYGLGYLARWLFTSEYMLGDLPALDFQYVISGIIPALLLALVWAAVAFSSRWRTRVDRTLARNRFLKWLSLVLLIGNVLLILHFGFRGLGTKGILLMMILTFTVLYVLGIGDDLGAPMKYCVPLLLCLMSLMLYFQLYMYVPFQFGGVKPRRAYVDLVRDEIATSTLKNLTSLQDPKLSTKLSRDCDGFVYEDKATGTERVVRSGQLDVYFASGDYLLVRAARGENDNSPINYNPLYELRKDTIRAIRWCR